MQPPMTRLYTRIPTIFCTSNEHADSLLHSARAAFPPAVRFAGYPYAQPLLAGREPIASAGGCR